ncbi:hypothetical protein FOY51_01055 [Antrihabitans cavernicola]|uniref:Mycothiol-dependent maleylpyruvate isomerase metal-binding domain-containing protein n=1 Tax=Antrihabitans cavernicola TaxID=2495913 RepID=A0A5A7SKP2_9NOCA|nr:hypothetical protein FOY51_01055 [Spelaeibacter cavernicola]
MGAAEIDAVVESAIVTLSGADLDWSAVAGSLEWTRWELLGHMADDLFGYAAQLGAPGITTYVPFLLSRVRADAPNETIHIADDAGVDGAMQVLRSTGSMLAGVVDRTADSARAHHVWGASDRTGFAAMGIVEVLVHMHDLTVDTDTVWSPSPELCAAVLVRLFPDVDVGDDPWQSLLWATGRVDLADRLHRESWRWDGAVRGV